MLLGLRLQQVVEILHHSLDGGAIPVGTDVLLPGVIGLQIVPEMNLTASPADPDQRRWQMQIAIALLGRSQRSTGQDPKAIALTIAIQLAAQCLQRRAVGQIQGAVESSNSR